MVNTEPCGNKTLFLFHFGFVSLKNGFGTKNVTMPRLS